MGMPSADMPAKQGIMQLRSVFIGSERSPGESSYSCVVNVLDKAWAIVEEPVGA